MSAILGGQVVTVRDAPLIIDPRYGKQMRDWPNAVETVITGCSLQPYTGQEMVTDREFTSSHVRLFAPYGPLPLATSRVVCDGVTYEVDGEPARWRDEWGAPGHVEATLKRLAG